MAVIEIAKILIRRGQENITGVPQLDSGEFGLGVDTGNLYIGRRVVEGAPTNENLRILTELDLSDIYQFALNTGTVAAHYQYREGSVPPSTFLHVTTSTVQHKLDSFSPSLTDFGLTTSTGDITLELRGAIHDLFANQTTTWDSPLQSSLRRKLVIPAGDYIISSAIELPPFTTIVGEGPGLTKITFDSNSTSTGMFRTVDAYGNSFEDVMQTGPQRAREVTIEGITFAYSTASVSNNALINLDNVKNASVRNCEFNTRIDNTSTTTYGFVDYGVGISIRGTGGGIGSGDVNLCENIEISNCTFDSLNLGIESTGSVVRSIFAKNTFNNLNQGIKSYTIDSTPAPTNSTIHYNRFQNILKEAIYIGENLHSTNHVSANNFFYQVGNGEYLSDYTVADINAVPVIRFLSSGNISRDDYFNRRIVANSTSSMDFFYYPLVEGNTVLEDNAVYTVEMPFSTTSQLIKIPLNGSDQKVNVDYQMTESGLSRKGTLLVNISSDGFATLTDNYNYSQSLLTAGPEFTAVDTLSSSNMLVVPLSNSTVPEIVVGYYYITGINAYEGYVAIIKSVDTTSNPGYYTIFTDSFDPTFEFGTPGNTYQFAYGDFAMPQFSVNSTSTYVNQGYVMLQCTNNSAAFPANVEYKISTQL